MTASAIGISNLFGLFQILGKAIRAILGQKVEVRGSVSVQGNLSVSIEVGPELENLIRSLTEVRQPSEEPTEVFQRALQGLIKGHEKKLAALAELDVADVTLGTEAIWHAVAVPEDMQAIIVRYVRLYTMTPSPENVVEDPLFQLLPPTLTAALQRESSSSDENDQPLTAEFGMPIIRPNF